MVLQVNFPEYMIKDIRDYSKLNFEEHYSYGMLAGIKEDNNVFDMKAMWHVISNKYKSSGMGFDESKKIQEVKLKMNDFEDTVNNITNPIFIQYFTNTDVYDKNFFISSFVRSEYDLIHNKETDKFNLFTSIDLRDVNAEMRYLESGKSINPDEKTVKLPE